MWRSSLEWRVENSSWHLLWVVFPKLPEPLEFGVWRESRLLLFQVSLLLPSFFSFGIPILHVSAFWSCPTTLGYFVLVSFFQPLFPLILKVSTDIFSKPDSLSRVQSIGKPIKDAFRFS
jgi:hypothetical protein